MAVDQDKPKRAALFLATVRDQLKDHKSPEVVKWLNEVTKLQNCSTKSSTIIGIIGATGAGKSALINALLDEERILPTNCMRACTAVVTEISYNNSDLPYRAEVEFVSKEQWRTELNVLFGDLLDDNGKISRDSISEDSEAGVAYSKIKGVYPGLSKEQIANASVDELMRHKSTHHLGTTTLIEATDAAAFYQKLQVYIDSREKVDLRLKATKSSFQVLEFWPLIKVVRLYLKSPILESGAVLVDLPGIHDSNAARAAVAQTYLKQCSALFIVAPITRAVDDKSAKSLLGQSFKQQLKLDGNFGNITFICSKTDDITLSEAQDSLNLAEELDPLHQTIKDLEDSIARLEVEFDTLDQSKDAANQSLHDADRQLDIYRSLLVRAEKGLTVIEPPASETPSKRKRATVLTSPRKKSTIKSCFKIDSDEEPTDEEVVEEVSCKSSSAGRVLRKDEIEIKIVELQKVKATAHQEYNQCVQGIKARIQQSKENKRDHASVRSQIFKICTAARNDYSRAAIMQDFADGVQEIDQELGAEDDPDNFDPSQEIRDYDEVARSLPIFCVSSRGYQKLCGRLKKEKKAWGFETAEDTEIPQLQAHCRQVAEALYIASVESFVGQVTLLCNSFKIWSSGQAHEQSLTDEELELMESALRSDLEEFSNTLLQSSKNVTCTIMDSINLHICAKFERAVEKAREKALETVMQWGAPVDRDNRANGGLHCLTYKATLRRNGLFAKKTAVHDFNRELTDPLVNHLAHGWETVFVRLIRTIFAEAESKCEEVVASFQSTITATALRYGISAGSLQLLEKQLHIHHQSLIEALFAAKSDIRTKQKDINRQFVPIIAEEMSDIYAECAAEHGPGMFVRVKRAMEKGIQELGGSMFASCTESIEEQLTRMMKSVDFDLHTKVQHITTWVERDYMQLAANRSEQVLGEERLLKDAIIYHVNNYQADQHPSRASEDPEVVPISQEEIKAEGDVDSVDIMLPLRSISPGIDAAELSSTEAALRDFLAPANASPNGYHNSVNNN